MCSMRSSKIPTLCTQFYVVIYIGLQAVFIGRYSVAGNVVGIILGKCPHFSICQVLYLADCCVVNTCYSIISSNGYQLVLYLQWLHSQKL